MTLRTFCLGVTAVLAIAGCASSGTSMRGGRATLAADSVHSRRDKDELRPWHGTNDGPRTGCGPHSPYVDLPECQLPR